MSERRPEAPDFSETTPVAVGTGVWALLFVLGLLWRHNLSANGHGWWVWTAAAGTVLGLFGYWFMARRQRRLHR